MKKTVFAACMLCAVFAIQAQESIANSGGDPSGSGGSTSYSVGQLVYTTNTGVSGTIAQGVQQSIELFTLSNPELTTINLTAITYPNPTTDYIVLAISDPSITNLRYTLYDVAGKVISGAAVENANTQIDMYNLQSGIYILKVTQNNSELKSFKILKK